MLPKQNIFFTFEQTRKMKPYRVIIIDDEKDPREALEKILVKYFPQKIKLVESVSSIKEGVKAIQLHKPDILFLDVEMPEENGFQLFNYFNDINFEVVFVTGYQKFAIEAIKCSALDYLLKPVNHFELKEVLERLDNKKQKENLKFKLETLVTNIHSNDGLIKKIALPTSSGYEYVKIGNIVYCQADDTYTKVYTNRAEKFIVSKPLKKIEQLLPDNVFFRIHKTYLANLNFIKSFNKSGGHSITLENDINLPVSHNRSKELVERMTKSISEM